MPIPFVDLKVQYRLIKDEIAKAISEVLDNTDFIMGKEVQRFESAFADFSGAAYGVGTSSGTAALHLALLAADVGAGSEVITVPNTFIATVEAISYVGARVVLVDINEHNYTIDIEKVASVISSRTKAIVPVHLYGQPADMDPLLEIARKHKLRVVQDAAQAHAAAYKNRPLGSLGDAACYSFYPAKNLGAYGEAGMVVTNDEEMAERMRMMRNHGQADKNEHRLEGYNYRLDTLQAAILGVKLHHLEEWTERRRCLADCYNTGLDGLDVSIPTEMAYAKHVYHLYVIRSKCRDALRERLRQNGITTGIHYPTPIHLQQAYRHLGYQKGDFPVAERSAREILSLPIYPELSHHMVREVAASLRKGLEGSYRLDATKEAA